MQQAEVFSFQSVQQKHSVNIKSMRGIVGSINWADSEALARMNNVQAHRGPDEQGTWEARLSVGSLVGLGSRRLAILDISPAGRIPCPHLMGG